MQRRTVLTAGLATGLAVGASTLIMGAPALAAAATPQKVLWVLAHPDDETIACGLSLRQHLEGGLDCHLLMCTRGTASSVRSLLNGTGSSGDWGMPHDPAAEGYEPLSEAAFGAARIREMANALGCLAAGTGRTVTIHEAHLQDGAVKTADVLAAIRSVVADISTRGEMVWLKGHSDLVVTEHPDHLAVGRALRQAVTSAPNTLGNLRCYIDPTLVGYTSAALPKAAKHPITPASGTHQSAATLNAYRAYNSWDPRGGTFAIGHQSVSGDWLNPPHNTYHL